MPAIEVSGLRKAYGSLEAVRGVDFSIEEGEVFGLLGPNGAGKTTTVEILEGYRTRTGGIVSVLGHDPEQRSRATASTSPPAPITRSSCERRVRTRAAQELRRR